MASGCAAISNGSGLMTCAPWGAVVPCAATLRPGIVSNCLSVERCVRRSSSFYSACLTVLCIVALGGGIARAQNPQMATPTGRGRDVPTAEAARLNDGPVVDGDVLDDPVWKPVPVIAGFKQYQPFEGQPVS